MERQEFYEDYHILRNVPYNIKPCLTSSERADRACALIDRKYTLDLFLPQNVKELDNIDTRNGGTKDGQKRGNKNNFPVVIFAHGGGWRRGDKNASIHYLSFYDTNIFVAFLFWCLNLYSNVGEALASRGIACAVINYPLTSPSNFVLIFECITSFLFSSLFIGITIGFFLLSAKSMFTVLFSVSFNWVKFANVLEMPLITGMCILLMSIQVLKLMIILFFHKNYRMQPNSPAHMVGFVSAVGTCAVGVICFSSIEQQLQIISISVSLTIEFCLMYNQMLKAKTKQIHCSTQALAVAQSVAWVKQYGHVTGAFNPDRLFLMGHSAGGHLITMVTIDESYLRDVNCCVSDIKGAISISGVYNPTKYFSGFISNFYIKPAFGTAKTLVESASPIDKLNKITCNASLPPFLVLNAENDYPLIEDAHLFVKQLKSRPGPYEFVIIQDSNHFSIITKFGKQKQNNYITDICVAFINDNM